MSGKLLVIEGLDGCGKATQSAMLFEALKAAGKPVRKISFPDYESLSSGPVRMYLQGAFGGKPDDVDCYAASVLFAVDRFASFRSDWQRDYEAGTIFVCDRYSTSNAVFQASKLPRDEWERYLSWLEEFEYSLLGIPRPDKVLFLNMSEQCSKKLMEKRYGGDESRKDIHEKDVQYQKRSREAALFCADYLGWQRIDCDADNKLLTIEEIHQKVMQAVEDTAF